MDPNIRDLAGMDLDSLDENNLQLVRLNEESAVVLERGIALTGYRIVDGKLHVQIRYDNIRETDNYEDSYGPAMVDRFRAIGRLRP
jgi:hypothetical protein